ncbi:MAG: class I SAM-dependent methyltransferase [Acidobacteriia bacterium]|nr:class I SAM-dependent methyltransferase [Terriglobia bacterium]
MELLEGYDVIVCLDCGAGFADDIPEQSVFDDYYRDLSKYDNAVRGGKESPASKSRFEEAASGIETFVETQDARILEIGCGSGHLLDALARRSFANLRGADPSPACASVAGEKSVPVEVATVSSIPAPEKPYDFLILMGVIEHIRDLDCTVDQFHRLLRIGGRVYIEVPDGSRLDPSLDAPFQEFSMEHINFFSTRSLTNLMHRRGFRAIATGRARRAQNETICLSAYGVYERSYGPSPMERDTETERGIAAYVQGCQLQDSRIRSRIEEALPRGEKMTVWGVGTHTLRLLATGGLDPSRISVFVDSNPKYQRHTLRGIPVISPGEMKGHSEPILISSRGFQREIHDQIRNRLGLTNRLILLYET